MSRYIGVCAALLVTWALLLTGVPAAAGAARTSADATTSGSPRADGGDLVFHGDAVHGSDSARRRPRSAWSGRRIHYRESIPAKWDWSLSRAVAKWNEAGGGVRFVRTQSRRKARLTISFGNVGAAAGMATVGRTRRAWVRLSPTYDTADPTSARNRIEVMAIFAHELGHVLGFGHTRTTCSLMAPMLDVVGCGMLPPSRSGYYRCRTLDVALVRRFVRIYGGRARFPGTWCLIDPLPPALTGVVLEGGEYGSLTVRWSPPRNVPPGSTIRIRAWQSAECGPAPEAAQTGSAAVAAGAWQGALPGSPERVCASAELVNRYGVGRAVLTRSLVSSTPDPAPDP